MQEGDREEQVAAYWLFSSLLVSGVGAIGQSDSFCHDTPTQRWRWGEQAVVRVAEVLDDLHGLPMTT